MKNFLLTIAFISLFFSENIFAQSNCLNFDGTDDFVNIGNVDATNSATKLTVEMWANISTWKFQGVLFSRRSEHANKLSLMENLNPGAFIVLIGNGNSVDVTFTSGSFTLDQWFHIAFIYDGDGATNADKLKIYINGSLVDGVSYSALLPATLGDNSPFMLGREDLGAASTSFRGKIDEVKVWSTARTITEINDNLNTSLIGNEAGLLLYYNFNQGVAGGDNTGLTTLNDNTLLGTYDGTLTNFALTGSTSNWVEGINPAVPAGAGTLGNPYQIATLQNLTWIAATNAEVPTPNQATRWAAYYIQTADIDASSTSTWNSGTGWSPIGNEITNFTGTYNGNSKTISGLYINRVALFQGFFGSTNGGSISNLGLLAININGLSNVGGLAGFTESTLISNCYSTGTVIGNQYIGGLIGNHYLGSVSSSFSSCNVTGSATSGGFVGLASGLIQNCYSIGNVTRISGGSFTDFGGFAGWSNGSPTISKCYSTGRVIYTNATDPTDKGFIGQYTSGTLTGNFWDTQTSLQATTAGTATGKTTAEMKTSSTFTSAGWDFLGESANGSSDYWNTSGGRNDGYPFLTWQTLTTPSGSGTIGAPYQIATLENLYWITASDVDVVSPNQATRWAASYTQTADIDASTTSTWDGGAGFSPIGNSTTNFSGSYDGQNHTTDGLVINRSTTDHMGMFGYINTAAITQIGLTNISISISGSVDTCNLGGLVGYSMNSTVSNSYSSGSVSGYSNVGGLIGVADGASVITNCSSSATVGGTNDIGGFIGENWNASQISKCYSSGNVTGSNTVGGFCAFNKSSSSISDCYCVSSFVSGSSYTGGFAGYMNTSATITNCYTTATLTGTQQNGFINGVSSSTITNCFWNVDTDGIDGNSTDADNAGATGKTTAEMKTNTTFLSAGWDYTIWNMGDGINNGYPYLKWQNPSGTPLPVELTSFSATTVGSTVKLSWNTETEINNYGFEVERCALSAERQAWEKIGFVNGSGNSNSPKDYSFVDDKVSTGKYSYRLKQIDNDGQFEYSKTIEVDMSGVNKFELTQNYPNPFNPTTTIQYGLLQTGMVRLTLYNILGQEIRTLVNEFKEAGTHTINLNARDLNSGVYIYKIESGSFTQTKKMTLVK